MSLGDIGDDLENKIIYKYYNSYHQTLQLAIANELLANDGTLVVNCYSLDNKRFKSDTRRQLPMPDVCIGIDSFHTPRGLYKFSAVYFKFAGYSVKINECDFGSMIPNDYYQKDNRVASITLNFKNDLKLFFGTNNHTEKVKLIIENYLLSLMRFYLGATSNASVL